MSDSQAQSPAPIRPASRKTSVWVWFVALLIAGGLLVAAVVWAGGVDQVSKMLGLGNLSWPTFVTSGYGGSAGAGPSDAQTTVTTVTAPASKPATASSLPPEALSQMFSSQVDSRVELTDLVAGRIHELSVGTPRTKDNSASVPVTATYDHGVRRGGTLLFARYSGTWYLFGFDSAEVTQPDREATPTTIDTGVVNTITQQQAEAGTQAMIVEGLMGGAFRKVQIDNAHAGPRTATVDIRLSGGTEPPSVGRFVCISKTDAGTTFWFVARFEKR